MFDQIKGRSTRESEDVVLYDEAQYSIKEAINQPEVGTESDYTLNTKFAVILLHFVGSCEKSPNTKPHLQLPNVLGSPKLASRNTLPAHLQLDLALLPTHEDPPRGAI